MNDYKTKKIISYLLFVIYVLFLCNTYILSDNLAAREGTGFSILRLWDELAKERTATYQFKDILLKIASMIPFGILLPLSRQKRCFAFTLTAGSIAGLVCEMLQIVNCKGFVCFDDILLATLGAFIGYKLFLLLCRKASDGFHYLYTYDNIKSKRWLVYLSLIFVFFCIINVAVNGVPAIPSSNNFFEREEIPYSEEVYNTFYTQLAAHETCVTFLNPIAENGVLNEQFDKVLTDHPELFWVTGGGHYQSANINNMSFCKFYPEIEGDINEIPAMEAQLNGYVDAIVSAANQQLTDYDKALYVHDYIVLNCQYDMNAYRIITSTQSAVGTDYATTAYGCLVNHTAVCEGYAKAYQLIMNKLGIECGYVSGSANNGLGGEPEGHAWNYIKLDGEYYFVDVTWDDPVYPDGTSNSIGWDYFCISEEEFLRDHAIDEGWALP